MDRAPDRAFAELRRDLIDRLAESLALRARGLVEPELARRITRLERRRGDPAQPNAAALARLDRDLREQIDRGAREHATIAGRRVERRAPRDLTKVVVLHDQHD